jgi:hypothetical protein
VSETVLDGLVGCLRAALAHDPNLQEEPVALLWPDEGAHWLPVIDRIGERLPVVSLGAYDPAARRGPAYWIRCVVAGTVEADLLAGTPVVYLPGVSRGAMRAADGCPRVLAPIAELQYRSQWFSHPNNRDWSPRALLSHPGRGLGLRLAEDAETRTALPLALERLLDEKLERVRKQLLDADYLFELVNEDPVWSLLNWLDDPQGYRARAGETRWAAFVQQCRADYDFDPTLDGEVSAARRLGSREGAWEQVWKRFAETPERYPGVVEQLGKARPEELIVDPRAWPQDNERGEEQLRDELNAFGALAPEQARAEVARLEAEHGWRRGTVWAGLERAPLAFALEPLGALAELTERPLAADGLDSLVGDYDERGWRVDDAVLRALAAAPHGPAREAVAIAAAALYRNWVDAGARSFQAVAGPLADSGSYPQGPPASTAAGTATVFVDGLRLDVARRVRDRLAGAGLEVSAATGLAALPTVTATAKPALLAAAVAALGPGPELTPANAETGARASARSLRGLIAAAGVQVLGPGESGDPSGAAWVEAGEIDHRGHDAGLRLVEYLDDEVGRIVVRIRELLEAGWQRVEVVTDHGWMLVPGAMEKVELPAAATAAKKGRCARLKDGAAVELQTVPWFWDAGVRVAVAPGASCFEANKAYEHGGLSPQECIVPRLTVLPGAGASTGGPELTKVKWLGLQCRVEFGGVSGAVLVDLRGLPAEPASSIAEQAKETSGAGRVSLLVPDEDHEGERAHLVLVDPDGRILAQREVVVGRNR